MLTRWQQQSSSSKSLDGWWSDRVVHYRSSCVIQYNMDGKFNANGKNMQCQSTRIKTMRHVKTPRDKPIVPRKITTTIHEDYRYHRSGTYKNSKGEKLTWVFTYSHHHFSQMNLNYFFRYVRTMKTTVFYTGLGTRSLVRQYVACP